MPAPTHEDAAPAGASLAELMEALRRPAAYGLPPDTPVEMVQTHASVVFLVGDRVYKIKKPVRFWDLLDYGTLALRAHWCREEVRLNRRLAPDIYLGVEPIVRREGVLQVDGEGEIVDHAVVMRRFDESATLAARLERGEVTYDDIDDVARRIAAFHQAFRLPAADADGAVAAFGDVLRLNFEGTPRADNAVFPRAPHEGLARRLEGQLAEQRSLLEARVAAERIVDGHGDIRLEHVLHTGEGWTIVDCVEFSARLRRIDPVSDMAFLSMDLTAAGHPLFAAALESGYAAAADEHDMRPLLPLFRGYRAYVRATVDYHASLEPERGDEARAASADGARRHLALAFTESFAGRAAPIIVLRGTSGSGKSFLSRSIAPLLRADVIRSDVVRKALLDMAPTDRPDADTVGTIYGQQMSIRTYAALLDEARASIAAGRAAMLDATYLLRAPRDAARALAVELDVPFAILDITCPRAVIETRIAARHARGDDASDADLAVYLQQIAEAEPLTDAERPHVVPYDSTTPSAPVLMDLITCLEAQS